MEKNQNRRRQISEVVASRKREFKKEVREERERDKKIKMEASRVKKEDILHSSQSLWLDSTSSLVSSPVL